MKTILIIEDEPELIRGLRTYLESANYKVISELRGDSGFSAWKNSRPDLVILDLNLPGMDGIEVAQEIRKQSNTPIIMLTARVEETDRIIGLELGADDYITKPFSPREVVARVKAVLRRAEYSQEEHKHIHIHDLRIDIDAFSVTKGEHSLEVTQSEFAILSTMAGKPGRVFSRLQLLEASQGEIYEGYERNIDTHIKNLRSKLGDAPRNPKYIETVFGVGYRFLKEV